MDGGPGGGSLSGRPGVSVAVEASGPGFWRDDGPAKGLPRGPGGPGMPKPDIGGRGPVFPGRNPETSPPARRR